MLPSFEAVSPAPAVAPPFVVSGGHTLAHAPPHALALPLSASNRYSVRPVPSTRILPSFEPASATDAPPEPAAGDADLVAGPPSAPPQPATASAITATPATAAVRARAAADRGLRKLVITDSYPGPRATVRPPRPGVEGRPRSCAVNR